MISQVPVWMSFVIIVTYALLVGLVSVGYQRAARLAGTPDRDKTVSWGTGIFLAAWLLIVVILGLQGFFVTSSNGNIPKIAYAVVPFALSFAWLFVSPALRKAVDGTPPQWVIGVQFNRILGALFLVSYAQGWLPAVFAIPAGVGDVLVSLAAPIVAYLFVSGHRRAHTLGLLWNVFGILDLLLAITLGVLTSPGPLHYLALDTPNLLMSSYPFVVIPAFGVPVWLLLHFFSLRKLARRRNEYDRSHLAWLDHAVKRGRI